LALAAGIVYGAGDFLGGLASRRTSTLAVVVWSQAAGFLLLLVAVPLVGGAPGARDLAWGALCGVVGAAAIALLYRGLAVGEMGVVSPITAILGTALPVAYGVLHNVRPSAMVASGIAIALVAVVAISWAPPSSAGQAVRGLPEAFAAGALFGIFFIVLAQVRAEAGLYPLIAARAASFLALLIGGRLVRASFRPARDAVGIIIGGGVCDMAANVLYVIAAHSGPLAVVAVLAALYPASTVALAAIVLRERLRALQWGGVVLALAGVGLISAGK